MSESDPDHDVLGWAVDIVSSYVSNNSIPAADLPSLLDAVYATLSKTVAQPVEDVKQPLTPPVPIRKSIADDYLVCLEDGKHFKSLKRHLQTVHGLSPEQYRERWSLNRDYPMVAPAYAKARSALAKGMGLGASRRGASAIDVDVDPEADLDDSMAPDVAVHDHDHEPEEAAVVETDAAEPEPEPAPKKTPRPRRQKGES